MCWTLGPDVSSVRSMPGTRVSGNKLTPPKLPGGYRDGFSSLLGGEGSDDTQEHIASVCSCVSGTRRRTTSVQHEIVTIDAWPLWPFSEPNRNVLKKCWTVVRSSQVTVLGCPPWCWLRKRMVPRIFVLTIASLII